MVVQTQKLARVAKVLNRSRRAFERLSRNSQLLKNSHYERRSNVELSLVYYYLARYFAKLLEKPEGSKDREIWARRKTNKQGKSPVRKQNEVKTTQKYRTSSDKNQKSSPPLPSKLASTFCLCQNPATRSSNLSSGKGFACCLS